MKKLVLLSAILVAAIVAKGQSVKSQALIIAGDMLQENGANKFSRVLGKALSTSGEMQYNIEQIDKLNTTTRNVNITYNYPNTFLNSDNQLAPSTGYEWVYPNDPNNFEVRRKASYPLEENSYLEKVKEAVFQDDYIEVITWNRIYTSPGQNFNQIVRTICRWRYGRVSGAEMEIVYTELVRENSEIFPSGATYPKNYFVPAGIRLIYDVQRKKILKTGIMTLFTCKWIYQDSELEGLRFEDFKNIKNNFPSNEPFFVVFTFSQNQEVSTFFGIEVRDNSNGKVVFENSNSGIMKQGVSYFEIIPSKLPPGEYLIIAEIEGDIKEKRQEIIRIY
jgi:hypothetical protein